MKKYTKFFIALLIIAIIGIIIYFVFSSNKNSKNFNNASKMSTNSQNSNSSVSNEEKKEYKEIASSSTKIMDKDDDRDNNIKISLSKINDIVIKNGDIFSFNEIVGCPTPEEGYKKAMVFVQNDHKEDYGGGNCQVSSTLYNAVLKVDDLEVIERHEHSQEVYYVEKGKDSAVAYGELDFKFKNKTR